MVSDTDLNRKREVVDAFLAASRDGDFDALLAVLDPDVVLRQQRGRASFSVSRSRVGRSSQSNSSRTPSSSAVSTW
jgi:RNA polymerase sigma-70 factor (ECF subfamily)